MMTWLNGEFLILYSSYDELLISYMAHLLCGGVYLINLVLLSIFSECGFEVLLHEMK